MSYNGTHWYISCRSTHIRNIYVNIPDGKSNSVGICNINAEAYIQYRLSISNGAGFPTVIHRCCEIIHLGIR